MKRTATKLLALLLALLMLGTMLVACKGDETTNEGGNNNANTGDTEVIPKYNLEELNMLDGSPKSNLIEYVETFEDAAGDAIMESLYSRKETTTANLNIVVNQTSIAQNSLVSQARTSHMSGGTYDMYMCYSLDAATLMTEGLYANLKQYQVMDFSKPWYPAKLVNDATIFGKLYFVTGDISANNVMMSNMIMYNKDLYTNLHIGETLKTETGYDSIYKLVEDGKWTWDLVEKLTANTWAEADNNGQWSQGDQFGFVSYSTVLDSVYYSAGFKTVTNDPVNGLVLSEDFTNAAAVQNLIDDIGGFLLDSTDCYTSKTNGEVEDMFAEKKVLFYLCPVSHIYRLYRKVDGLTYGVLPIPKYSADQDAYGACQSNPYTNYGVSVMSQNAEIAAAYLHYLGKYSYEMTRPVVFEQTIKLKYADRPEDSVMWDYIIDAQTYDVGRLLGKALGTNSTGGALTQEAFRTCLMSKGSWSGALQSFKLNITGKITELNATLKELP